MTYLLPTNRIKIIVTRKKNFRENEDSAILDEKYIVLCFTAGVF